MNDVCSSPRHSWLLSIAVFILILIAQLALVAAAGTDIPFHDQWDAEGRWLYPACRDGTLHIADLLRPHNEHRITWTHLLNLGLFIANGQWDPLAQMIAIAVIRSICGAGIAWYVARRLSWKGCAAVGTVVTVAFL